MTTKEKIQNLKNFATLDKSFKEWLTTCPRDYIWQIDEVTKDHEGTFTFKKTESLLKQLLLSVTVTK